MKILFTKTDQGINICIPKELLVFAIENNPENKTKISDIDQFILKTMFELEYNLGSTESGLTGLQELLDKAAMEVVESGDTCIELLTD